MTRKHLVTLATFVFITCIAVRSTFIQGLFRPVRIAGGSMADTLLGPHFRLHCQDCGLAIRYDVEYPPGDGRVVCPNCGRVNSDPATPARIAGQRVLLDRLAYRWRRPERWEVVAFRTRGADDYFAVKRVVGLPGESVCIRHGEVYTDGQIRRKTLEQLRAMAIPVHDSAHQPDASENLPPRWRAESSSSAWQQYDGNFHFEPDVKRLEKCDWLAYHHWRCVDSPAPRCEEYAVLDNYGYNQELSRQLHCVTDLLLVCHAQVDAKGGTFALRAHDGRESFGVYLRFGTREASLYRGQRHVVATPLPRAAYARDVVFELALCDRQIMFAIDHRVVLYHSYEDDDGETVPTSRPLCIGADGLSATIRRLQVLRDLYYLDPTGVGWDWSAPEPLGDNQLFVIGDNVPISRDSRHWIPSGVPCDRLLGRVLQGP